MSESEIGWVEDQWNRVRQVVHDEAMSSRVAASFLPLFGPLAADVQTVPKNELDVRANTGGQAGPAPEVLAVDDYEDIRLATLSANVMVRSAQMADPELTSALMMFRRAANVMARIEDAMIFTGQAGVDQGPNSGIVGMPDIWTVSGGGPYSGLIDTALTSPIPGSGNGEDVFVAVVDAIQTLERHGHLSPFACVLGDDLFRAVNTPVPGSMVLPRDSITPFLDGPLLRSSTLPSDQGIVVSTQAAPIEIVVPSDISVRFLQRTVDGKFIFRVSQKFVLRIKDFSAVVRLQP